MSVRGNFCRYPRQVPPESHFRGFALRLLRYGPILSAGLVGMSVTPDTESKIVYLFSSAPPDRPNYKRGVLNALCYPPSHQMELSYKRSYISADLLNQGSAVKGRRGVFVFIDYKPESDHDFIPIRFVTLMDISAKEEARTYQDTTRFQVRVETWELNSFRAEVERTDPRCSIASTAS